jgi:hypothetical protein
MARKHGSLSIASSHNIPREVHRWPDLDGGKSDRRLRSLPSPRLLVCFGSGAPARDFQMQPFTSDCVSVAGCRPRTTAVAELRSPRRGRPKCASPRCASKRANVRYREMRQTATGSTAGTPGSDRLERDLPFAAASESADGRVHPDPAMRRRSRVDGKCPLQT